LLPSRHGPRAGAPSAAAAGGEKARRAAARFDLSAFDRIHACGDTAEDEPLLAMATDRFYRTMPETVA
jgi:hypothetical protein